MNSSAQDANLIFFDFFPHANNFNPAIQPDSTLIVFAPNIYIDAGTSTFGLKDIFSTKEGNDNKMYFDLNNLIEHSDDENFLYGTIDYSAFFVGKILPAGYYASFAINERNNYNFIIPKDLFELSRGNADYETETLKNFNLDGLSANGISYTSYSFGLSKKIGSALKLGLHINFLDGKYVTETQYFNASIQAGNDNDEININADVSTRQSAPGLVSDHIDDVYYSIGNFSHPLFLNNNHFKNFGFSGDFGFQYSPGDKTTIMGSVTDIGFINWNTEQKELHFKGSYNFSGLNLSPDSEGYFDVEKSINAVADSLEDIMEPVLNSADPFSTRITPRIIFGISRILNPRLQLSGLFRAGKYPSYTDYRYTLGAIYKLSPKFSFSLSTSRKNNRIGNLGAGLVFRSRYLDMFISSENFELLFANSSSINFSFGMNLILLNTGYPKE
ncbi:MAG: DUF5723 family protein [Kiritimatiellae bacterium]|nr:DUF5723 family protein [Kiritimatiellia bacterium]